MSELRFLSPALADAGYRSPLARALAGTELRDLSELGKVEVPGEPSGAEGYEVVRSVPGRTLVLCEAEAAPRLAAELNGLDLSAALCEHLPPREMEWSRTLGSTQLPR